MKWTITPEQYAEQMIRAMQPPVSAIRVGVHATSCRSAGEKIGAAMEKSRRRRWWQSGDAGREELVQAWDEFRRADDRLREFVEEQVTEAYNRGVSIGQKQRHR